VDAVVCSGGCAVGEGVEDADGEGWGHRGGDVVWGEPADTLGLVGRCGFAADGVAAEDEGDDPASEVLVGAGEAFDLDGDAGLFGDLTADTVLEGFVEFEDPAGRLRLAGVAALDGQDAAVLAHHDASDADGVVRVVGRL
jgi:hypothetical protein